MIKKPTYKAITQCHNLETDWEELVCIHLEIITCLVHRGVQLQDVIDTIHLAVYSVILPTLHWPVEEFTGVSV